MADLVARFECRIWQFVRVWNFSWRARRPGKHSVWLLKWPFDDLFMAGPTRAAARCASIESRCSRMPSGFVADNISTENLRREAYNVSSGFGLLRILEAQMFRRVSGLFAALSTDGHGLIIQSRRTFHGKRLVISEYSEGVAIREMSTFFHDDLCISSFTDLVTRKHSRVAGRVIVS
jgi:hypothetical protein